MVAGSDEIHRHLPRSVALPNAEAASRFAEEAAAGLDRHHRSVMHMPQVQSMDCLSPTETGALLVAAHQQEVVARGQRDAEPVRHARQAISEEPHVQD